MYFNKSDALADTSHLRDIGQVRNHSAATLWAARDQLREAGGNPEFWLDRQKLTRPGLEIDIGIEVRPTSDAAPSFSCSSG